MNTVARRRAGFTHDVEVDANHSLVLDEPRVRGGADEGPRPTELLAAALAGCTAITVEMYAERKGWDLGELEVEVDYAYEEHTPTSFEVVLRLPEGLDEERRRRLLKIAAKCPVHKVIAGQVPITVSDRLESL